MSYESSCRRVEPKFNDVMDDPIMNLLLRSDNLTHAQVRNSSHLARQRMATRAAAKSSLDRHDPMCRISRLCGGILPIAGSAVALFLLLLLSRI